MTTFCDPQGNWRLMVSRSLCLYLVLSHLLVLASCVCHNSYFDYSGVVSVGLDVKWRGVYFYVCSNPAVFLFIYVHFSQFYLVLLKICMTM